MPRRAVDDSSDVAVIVLCVLIAALVGAIGLVAILRGRGPWSRARPTDREQLTARSADRVAVSMPIVEAVPVAASGKRALVELSVQPPLYTGGKRSVSL